MRKTIILVVMALVAVMATGQVKSETSEHLTFKGVPIDGTLKEFCSSLQQKGFTPISAIDDRCMLQGDFAGYKKCKIVVITYGQKDVVCGVGVIFPELETGTLLFGNYFVLKEMLTQKYGEPTECEETFQTFYQPNDDDSRMHQVKMDRCKYFSTYDAINGRIMLSINHIYETCYVNLIYRDKINSDAADAEAMDDL
jgi:hypothetical protein